MNKQLEEYRSILDQIHQINYAILALKEIDLNCISLVIDIECILKQIEILEQIKSVIELKLKVYKTVHNI